MLDRVIPWIKGQKRRANTSTIDDIVFLALCRSYAHRGWHQRARAPSDSPHAESEAVVAYGSLYGDKVRFWGYLFRLEHLKVLLFRSSSSSKFRNKRARESGGEWAREDQ